MRNIMLEIQVAVRAAGMNTTAVSGQDESDYMC